MLRIALVLLGVVLLQGTARADEPLGVVTLPGLRMPLPKWRQTERGTDFTQGAIRLAAPVGSGGRSVDVRWQRSEKISRADLEQIYARVFDGAQLGPGRPVKIGPHEGESMVVSAKGKPIAVLVHWHCPEDGRELMISAYGSDEAELRSLTERMIAGTTCHSLPAESTARPPYPELSPPRGFKRGPDSGAAHVFVNDKGDTYALQPGLQGPKLATDLAKDAKLRKLMMGDGLGFQDVQLGETVTVKDGRQIWTAAGKSEGEHIAVAITAWYCPALDRSFLAYYFTPTPTSLPAGKKVLSGLICPKKR